MDLYSIILTHYLLYTGYNKQKQEKENGDEVIK